MVAFTLREGPPYKPMVLQAVAETSLSVEDALDWLCFNLDASELPGSFAGNTSSRAAGNKIEVLGRQRPGERSVYCLSSRYWDESRSNEKSSISSFQEQKGPLQLFLVVFRLRN